MSVIPFPRRPSTDELWDSYHALMRAQIDSPALAIDRAHVQATVRAYRAFCEAYGDSYAQDRG